jgi:hypothetical protein
MISDFNLESGGAIKAPRHAARPVLTAAANQAG